jgi:alpha-L-fucosidase
MKPVFAAALLLCSLPAFAAAPAGLGDAEMRADLERVVRVTPHPRQIAWQSREFIAFIHFGPNTFSGREWGTGREEPKLFNPTALDARQWVRVCAGAGMRQIILTAKHHDGFCLWPSRFTPHSVSNSPWRNGRGDVVRELGDACREAGMKLGIYLSPADLNAIERGVYGSKNPPQRRVIPSPVPGWTPKSDVRIEGEWDEYNTLFLNQLFELLTEYGEVVEVWFDGANPKPGTGQNYAYQDWYKLIRLLQPGAVIFGKGPDVRWVGNEAGGSRAEEWSVVPLPVAPEQFTWPDMTGSDLGSRAKIKGAPWLAWYPAETDVSIRPGWFYHENEDGRVKSVGQLLDIYHRSVGGNSLFLLNLPPDQRGLIHETDARRMAELGAVLRATFTTNFALGARATASLVKGGGFAAATTLDDDANSFWTTADWSGPAEIVYELPRPARFNMAMLQEHIASGQRIEGHAVDVFMHGEWREVARARTVGYKRLLRFPTVTTDKVRLRITGARVAPTVSAFGLFHQRPLVPDPEFTRNRAGEVTLRCADTNALVRYTLDGSEPNRQSAFFLEPIPLPEGGTIKARAIRRDGTGGETLTEIFGAARADWTAMPAEAAAAIDEDRNTVWTGPARASITVDLGRSRAVEGITYLPPVNASGLVEKYAISAADDFAGLAKPPAVKALGSFGNIQNNPVLQTVRFAQPVAARWLKFTCEGAVGNSPATAVAELGVLTAPPGARPSTVLPLTQDRDYPGYDWAKRFAAAKALVRSQKPELVFLGDSITHAFGGQPSDWAARGGEVWQKFYARRNVVNLGCGWERTENVLWRLDHGILDGAAPKVVVLMIGTNNLDLNTPDEIVLGVEAVIARLNAVVPRAKILLLGIFPRGQKPDARREKLAAVNARLAEFDGRHNVTWLDIGAKFLNADGTISSSVMNDHLHPTAQGYAIWAEAMEPTLARLLAE